MIHARRQEPGWDLSGGRLCLDFANTLNDRLTDHAQELLNRYTDLVSWSRQVGIVTEREALRLMHKAGRQQVDGAAVLERAIALREAIYRLFSAVAGKRQAPKADLAVLNTALAETLPQSRIVSTAQGFGWGWTDNEEALDRVLWPVVRSAASLLTSGELAAVRECAAANCGWLFLDTSRNRSRRWCNMQVCGNRAKARRHYERQQGKR